MPKELRRPLRSPTIGMRDRERADIILWRLDGVGAEAIAERLATAAKRVSLWCERLEASGLDGLFDRPVQDRKASIRRRRWRALSERRHDRRRARRAGAVDR